MNGDDFKEKGFFENFKDIPKIYFIAFLFITLAICTISLALHAYLKSEIIEIELKKYSQTNSLQSAMISKFLSERMFSSYLISDNIFAHSIINELYYSQEITESKKRAWLMRFNKNNDYYTIALYDKSLKMVYTLYDNPESLFPPSDYYFNRVLSEKTPILSQAYICENCRKLHLDIITPILKNSKVSFMILLRMDLRDYIIPKLNEFNANDFDAYSVILFSDSFALNVAHGVELIKFNESALKKIKSNEGMNKIESAIDSKDYYIISSKIDNTEWQFLTCIPVKFIESKTAVYTAIVLLTSALLIILAFFSLALILNSSMRKITEKELFAEKEKQALMKHYDLLMEMASDMILLLDKMGFIKYANRIAQKNYGNEGRSILGMNFNSMISDNGSSEEIAFDDFLFSSSSESGVMIQSEHTFSNKMRVPVEIRVKRFYLYNENYYQFIIRDISDRVKNENALKESNQRLAELNEDLVNKNTELKAKEQERIFHINLLLQNEKKLEEYSGKFRSIFDTMQSCIVIYKSSDGENFTIFDMNKSAEKTEKVSRENVMGKNVEDVFPGINKFGLLDILKRVYKTGKGEFKESSLYEDERIRGWRENYVYKLSKDELVVIYTDESDRRARQTP